MRRFEYAAPQTLDQAIELLAGSSGHARPLAGGTDIVAQMKEGETKFPLPSRLVSLRRIPDLKGIGFSEDQGLRLGAGVTMSEIVESAVVRDRYPILAEGAGLVGSRQTMNVATVGGNLCNAAPSADTACPLLACEAQAVIAGPEGRRTIALEDLFAGPGLTVLGKGDILVELRLPLPAERTGSVYVRHTPRKRMDIAVTGVAVVISLGEDGVIQRARMALGAVGPTPFRARRAEAELEGQQPGEALFARAAAVAASEAKPIGDLRGSAEFRRHLAGVMTERCLQEALGRARGK